MEIAYTQLRDKVWSGDLKPGDRLVNRTLGEELGVSTVTVREAIHRLASDGVVEHVPNAGAYVRNLSTNEMVDLFSFRAWLDLFTAREAARKIQRHELDRLQLICKQMRDLVVSLRDTSKRIIEGDRMDKWLEIDHRFHRVMVKAAHNSWLEKVTDDIHLLAHVMRSKSPESSFTDAVWTYRQHAEITRALEKRDSERACEWMRIHGDQALATLLNQLDSSESDRAAVTSLASGELGKGIAATRLLKKSPSGNPIN